MRPLKIRLYQLDTTAHLPPRFMEVLAAAHGDVQAARANLQNIQSNSRKIYSRDVLAARGKEHRMPPCPASHTHHRSTCHERQDFTYITCILRVRPLSF